MVATSNHPRMSLAYNCILTVAILILVQTGLATGTTAQAVDFTFIAVSDLHIGYPVPQKDKESFPYDLKERNKKYASVINDIENYKWPSGKKVNQVKGVVIAGDITEGDTRRTRKKKFTWEDEMLRHEGQMHDFESIYGTLKNPQKSLKYPVFEGLGNHDFTILNYKNTKFIDEESLIKTHPVIKRLHERNEARPKDINLSVDPLYGIHYHWYWNDVLFIHLNNMIRDKMAYEYNGKKGIIYDNPEPGFKRPMGNFKAFSYLTETLKNKKKSTKGIVIISHYPPFLHPVADQFPLFCNLTHFSKLQVPVLILSGHKHHSSMTMWGNVYPSLVVGSPMTPMAMTLIRFDGKKFSAMDINMQEAIKRTESKTKNRVLPGYTIL